MAVTFAGQRPDQGGGSRALAVGNPFGIGETVTSGIISATGRNIGLLHDVQGYEDFIQTDAAINPGNSGGALVDIDGRLIGINTAILSRSGGACGGRPRGARRHGQPCGRKAWCGPARSSAATPRGGIQNITPALEDSFNLSSRDGALVASVMPDGPAARAGIQAGDVITRVDGRGVSDANALALTMSEAPGTPVHLDVIREGKALRISATTEEKPGTRHQRDDAYAANDDHGVLQGVAVEDLNSDTRQQLNLPAQLKGALVSRVDPDLAVAQPASPPADVILSINQRTVTCSVMRPTRYRAAAR